MPNLLKNLKITSADLVDNGANPDAYIKIFKRLDETPKGEQSTEKTAGNKGTSSVPTDAPADKIHPDVKKALSEFEAFKKAKNAEIAELKKTLKLKELAEIAKKYEIIGKKPEELADTLYKMLEAGGDIYNEYVSALDQHAAVMEQSGLFKEIGSDRSGVSGTHDIAEKLGAKAAEIAKSGAAGGPKAFVEAWEQNPDLANAYNQAYYNDD